MKRKADEWTPSNARPSSDNQACCRPSLLDQCYGGGTVVSVSSNSDNDDNSLPSNSNSNPYLFMNFDPRPTPSKQRNMGNSSATSSAASIQANVIATSTASKEGPIKAATTLDGEQLLASEMQALSVNEREEIYDDIHGVGNKVSEETPEFIHQKLRLLEQQLITRHQPRPKKHQRRQQQSAATEPYEHPSAYQEALFLAPRYVKNPNFRSLFLRSESYDVGKAAVKFVNHFELKKKFFGVDKLGKAIDFSDLDEDDVEALRNGGAHMLPNFRDGSGRRVFFDNYHCYRSTNDATFRTHVRLVWYAFMRDIELDAEAQRNGAIIVMSALGVSTRDFTQAIMEQRRNAMVFAMPIHGVCGHFCLNNPQLRPLFSMFLAAAPKRVRLRTRIHFGSDMECQYSLATYGITSDVLSYDSDGSAKRDRMEEIISTFRKEEESQRMTRIQQETSQGVALYATSYDVLIGKGAPYQNSRGALRMERLVEESMEKYWQAKADKFAKTMLFLDVVHVVKKAGGRFLKRHPRYGSDRAESSDNRQVDVRDDTDVWIMIDNEAAREKVATTFRAVSKRLQNR